MKIYTTITEKYAADWNLYEGIREFIQNGLDAEDSGYKFNVNYFNEQLIFTNEGATISKEDLLLGNTSKADDKSKRGKYGEGFKIGCLALKRLGKEVIIADVAKGMAIYCEIEKHPDFESNVLTFDIQSYDSRMILGIANLRFTVDNITKEEYKKLKPFFLNLNTEPIQYLATPMGNILLDEQYSGRVFCGDLYVCDLKNLAYGYNFKPEHLPLNRDRNLASTFDICWRTSKMWSKVGSGIEGKDKLVIEMLENKAIDIEYLESFQTTKLGNSIVSDFKEKYGENAYPISCEYEKKEVESLGLNPIITNNNYTKVIQESVGSISKIREKISKLYKPIDCSNVEINCTNWVRQLMLRSFPDYTYNDYNIEPVQFSVDTRSILENNRILVNYKLFTNIPDVLSEVAKQFSTLFSKNINIVWKQIATILINDSKR